MKYKAADRSGNFHDVGCQNSVLIVRCLTARVVSDSAHECLIQPVQLSVNSPNLLHATPAWQPDKFNAAVISVQAILTALPHFLSIRGNKLSRTGSGLVRNQGSLLLARNLKFHRIAT